jgi:formylglycine-generating enzyme required for sulfatase activity
MVVIPAGQFIMGSPPSEAGRQADEGPQHVVNIANSFAVSKFELTFDEWDACVAGGGCATRISDSGWGRGERPAINVSWEDAQSYVSWLSRITGKPYRLLTEAEYEYAARAGTMTAYPWGDNVGPNNANCNGCGSKWDNAQTAPVGSFAANGFGLYDMMGNVFEWVQDCYHDSYNGAPANGSAWINDSTCDTRVVRGSSWSYSPRYLRAANRHSDSASSRDDDLGFRVARTLLTR